LRLQTPRQALDGQEKQKNWVFLTANIGWNCLNADAIRRMKTQDAFVRCGPAGLDRRMCDLTY
jgi:hypothetical protein